jgi:hypothetical protein
VSHTYLVLSDEDKTALRMQRLRGLEADLFRHELELEEAADNAVRESVALGIADLQRRIAIHRVALHLDEPAEAS